MRYFRKIEMNLVVRILFLVTVFVQVVAAQTQRKEIVGYYPSWKWNWRNNNMPPEKIPFEKLTVINYAFFYPKSDGSLVGRDTVGDRSILGATTSAGKNILQGHGRLTDMAHLHGVKVLLSIGGWEDSNNFASVAGKAATRINFAHSCLQEIRAHGFDGIDIDWEYPGYPEHNGTPQDKENFTLLLRTVRDSLSAYGHQIGRQFSLTAALPAYESALKNFEVDSVANLLDQLNIMTYDFNGPWSPLSGHNAPLYSSTPRDSFGNADAAFRMYTRTFGIQAAKINLGVPFYGHALLDCESLNAKHGGVDTVHFPSQGAFYYDIAPHLKEFTRYWDERAKVPYLVSKTWNAFVSYDDEESVAYKARYVLENNACGLIIWEITGDCMPDGTTPLLNVVTTILNGSNLK